MTFRVYLRSLLLLADEKRTAFGLALAGLTFAALQLAEPVLFGRVIDALSRGDQAFPLIALWAGLGLFGIVASVSLAIVTDRFAHRRRLGAMQHVFEHSMMLPASYHSERGSSAVVRAISSGSDALFWIWLASLRDQLPALFGICLIVPTAFAIDARMAGILLALAVFYTVLNVLVISKTVDGQRAVERHHNELSGRVGDVLSNVTLVQSYARFQAEAAAVRQLVRSLLSAQYPVLNWWGLLTVLQRSAATLTMVSVFGFGALLVERGELTIGEIVSFVAFGSLMIGKLDQVSSFFARTHERMPALTGFFALLDEAPGVVDKPDAHALHPVQGRIAYEHVSFRYDSGQGVFDLSFDVEPGQTVALVGPTGSGKSTTLALLQRLRTPSHGAIRIDGHDVRDVQIGSLRDAMAVVFQEAGLFNRSIADNIALGSPDAGPAEIRRAAKIAEAHEFTTSKREGYDLMVGERGSVLSGGERQRISLARAILKDAPILVLDEATSALDARTESKIKKALDQLRRGRTTFIIAHRLSTVVDADQILVFDHGRIVERGRFEQLVRQGGLFSKLVNAGGFAVPRAA